MIAVVDYHKGNLKSVERGLRAQGADAHITDDPAVIERAQGIVLPGVGSFADAAASMDALGQSPVVRDAIVRGVPFLGICLGLHLLFDGGTEHGDGAVVAGLGLIEGVVDALPALDASGNAYKIPHVGWNNVDFREGECALFEGIPSGEYFYFTHSFAAPSNPQTVATTTHSVTFPSAVALGDCAFGVQFHPEKSSDAGAAVLRNFVALCND